MNKFKLILAVWLLPVSAVAQQVCTITVNITGGIKEPAVVMLSKQKISFSGGKATLTDTLDKAKVVTLQISYKDAGPNWWRFPVYAMSGQLHVHITNAANDPVPSQRGKIVVEGPKLSMDYTNLLEEPVKETNQKYNAVKTQLKITTTADTVVLKKQLNVAMHECWGVPRTYVQQNPTSPLAIMALKMMDQGDPTLDHPAQELADLFHSLSPELQNSEEGKQYSAKLEKMLNK